MKHYHMRLDPQLCLPQLFEAQVARTPHARAVVYEGKPLTYAELNRAANALAHSLRTLGVGPEQLVGLCVERSLDLVIGILGILKAGGAYLPLDPAYPQDRLHYMLHDSKATILVTQRHLAEHLPAHEAQVVFVDSDPHPHDQKWDANPPCELRPHNLLYSIYTSGSTGRPKGTLLTHANVVRLFTATDAWFSFTERDVWTLFHSYAFDFSVWELWGALLYGGTLIIVPYLLSRSPEAFYRLVCEQQVTILNQTPSAFWQFLRADETLHLGEALALRTVIFGGEALDIRRLAPWFERHGDQHPQLVNMYGITETTVHVTYRPLTREDVHLHLTGSAIGRPLPDLEVYILDQANAPVPVGISGEMFVGGAGLGRGYNQAEYTATRFIPHPFSTHAGARLYKTGDLARYLPDGSLEYLGRADDQVKIRGFRIELGEIAATLERHPAVREAVILAREAIPGDTHLIAYVTTRHTFAPSEASVPPSPQALTARDLLQDLRRFVHAALPDYMVPSAILFLDAFPLTANGKVDRGALPVPGRQRPDLTTPFVAPTTVSEQALAAIWCETLGWESIGIDDTFFELGGHSLSAAHIIARVHSTFHKELPLRAIFDAPTIRSFLATIENTQHESRTSEKKQRPGIATHARKAYRPT